MALLDLSEVTRSVITLIREAFVISPAWTLASPPEVLPEPPIRITGEGLGFYLYHIQENAHYKNLPSPGREQPPLRFTPMAINLYYQLSANSILDDGTGAFQEQLMMGIALKALRDFPEINDTTQINSTLVLRPSLRGNDNRFSIALQPIPYSEAVHYWTAGQSPLKLAAYYELSVVFLEPEQTQTYTGRVLTYGTYIFTEGAPRITGSQNILEFTIPGETGSRQVKLQPAQVPPDRPLPAPLSPNSQVDFFGTGFVGNRIELLLIHPRWSGPAVADAAWAVTLAASNRLTAQVRETAILESSGATVDVLPGIYAAQVRVVRLRTLPNGEVREFGNTSNQFPFAVTPRIDSIAGPVANIITVTGYRFQHPDLADDDLEVYLGETRLTRDAGGAFDPSEYRVTAPGTLEIHLPGGLTSGQRLPVRILVAGSESPPAWITIP
jgi:hypothetical protein